MPAHTLEQHSWHKADIYYGVCLQIAYEVATSHGLQRVLFGGFFIRANGFTMETITFALDFWSKASRIASSIISKLWMSVASHADQLVSSLQVVAAATGSYGSDIPAA